jgi:hypothetical protein
MQVWKLADNLNDRKLRVRFHKTIRPQKIFFLKVESVRKKENR